MTLRTLLLSLLLASSAEAVPITFGASVTTTQHQDPQGFPTGMDISAIGVGLRFIAVPDSPLRLTVPSPVQSQFGDLFGGFFDAFGDVMLTLQTSNGAVLGGYRFGLFRHEHTPAQYVLCTSRDNCVTEIRGCGSCPPFIGPPACASHVEASFTLEPVPEPSTLLLLSTTAGGLAWMLQRRRR